LPVDINESRITMHLVASIGEMLGRDDLQSAARELEPMRWRRGVARFTDPRGRQIPASKANRSSWVELVEPEEYELPSGTADASLLPLELTGLALTDDVTAALNGLWFVRRWGLLRNGPGASTREPWADFLEAAWAHANVFEWRSVSQGRDFATFRASSTWRHWSTVLGWPSVTDAEVPSQLSQAVAIALSGGMSGCTTLAVSVEPGRFALSMRCPTLWARSWYEAAVLIAAQAPLRACDSCGRQFLIEDPRMRYCSPRCREREKKRRAASQRKEISDGST
jgi:hypothetical protein